MEKITKCKLSSAYQKNRFYTGAIPELHNKVIYTSTNGWVVLKDLNSMNLCLLNPTSMEMVQLPPLEGIDDHQVTCIRLTTPSNLHHQCHVLFIDHSTCMFYFCHLGDENFSKQAFETHRPCYIVDATYYIWRKSLVFDKLWGTILYIIYS